MIDVLRGLAIVVVFFLAGTWFHRLGVPIPGGVLGLLLFFAALSSGAIKLRWVEQAAALLLRHMVLLFVPLTVALIDIRKVISSQAGAILASLVVSFLAVLFVTGWLGSWMLSGPESPIDPALEPAIAAGFERELEPELQPRSEARPGPREGAAR